MASRWRTGYRSERFEYRLLRSNLAPAGLLTGVESCSLSGSVNADVRWGGRLRWSGIAQPDWSQYLVHPWYIVAGAEGVEESFPLCPPCYVKAPATVYSDDVPQSVDLQLYDISYKLAQREKAANAVGYPAGITPTTELVARLVAAGVPRWSVTPSAAITTAALNYDQGSSEMKVCNGLLGVVGYWSLHTDPYGAVIGEPYLNPSKRSEAYRFAAGATSIIGAGRTVTKDDFSVPNRLSGSTRSTDAVPSVTATVILDSIYPSSPYAFANRGYWVDAEPMRDQDATDVTVLTTRLSAALLGQATAASSQTVTHAWLPEVTLGSLVAHDTDTTRRYTVQKMDVTCELGLQVSAEWREVA